MFENLIEQSQVWNRLVSSHQNRRIANAYLFHGPSGTGKEGYALKFSALINCLSTANGEPCGICPSCKRFEILQHPNLTLVVPFPRDKDISAEDEVVKALSDSSLKHLEQYLQEKSKNPYAKILLPKANSILINSIRDLKKKVYLKSSGEGRKMVLIFEAHKLMTQQGEAGNALLKILEEPPENTTFLLVTDHHDQLSETIRSRCHGLYFAPLSRQAVEKYLSGKLSQTINSAEETPLPTDSEEIKLIAHLSQGNVHVARALLERDLQEVKSTITSWVNWISLETEDGWRQFLHHTTQLNRSDPRELNFYINLLLFWFRDAMHLKDGNEEGLILENCKSELKSYVSRFPSAEFGSIGIALENCVDFLSRNYNINLALMNLLFEVQEHLNSHK